MKLPDKRDPHGDKAGAELRANVIETLVVHGVAVRRQATPPISSTEVLITAELEKDDVLEVVVLEMIIGGQMISWLARKFGIPIAEFHVGQKRNVQ